MAITWRTNNESSSVENDAVEMAINTLFFEHRHDACPSKGRLQIEATVRGAILEMHVVIVPSERFVLRHALPANQHANGCLDLPAV
jgi:hypothetical protein